jgi:hypothetical protein
VPNKKRLAHCSQWLHRPHCYRAAKKSHGQLGDFFAALKTGEERGERAGYHKGKKRHCARWRKNGEPAKSGCFQKPLSVVLDITDLLMEVVMPGYADAVETW